MELWISSKQGLLELFLKPLELLLQFWKLSFYSNCSFLSSCSFWFKEENVVLKFTEQGGTPQNLGTSSSLTAHLRSLSKGESPVTSPFQNYSSIHSQSRSASSPSLHSRSPSISNMAALRWDSNMHINVFLVPSKIAQGQNIFSKLPSVLKIWKFILSS